MGRPTWIKPAEDSWTRFIYTRATSPAALAEVYIGHLGNGGGAALAENKARFDSLGRLWQEQERMPNGTWSIRETLYNALGWKASVSEMGAVAKKTQFLLYDPFARPGIVRPPDGPSHDLTFSYSGVRSTSRTAQVATAYNTTTGVANKTAATTVETFDRQGRLVQVTEPNSVITKYEYDIGNRLKRVCQAASGVSCGQERLFTYDNRGFMTSEKHPEKGAGGNGTKSYFDYTSRGLVQRVVDGPNDLTYSYDRAERLTQVRETGGAQRLLKVYTYGTTAGNGPGDYRNGKTVTAQRYNYPTLGGITHTALVTETYFHGGREGRVSRRDTALAFNGTTGEVFTQGFAYNPLGQTETINYPQCAFAACVSTPRTVTNTFTFGRLTSVAGYTGTVPGQAAGVGITYHPNGLLSQLAHSNGVVVTQANDPNGIHRPASITAALGGTTLWQTGTYQYDGAGNIWKMGTSWFEHDSLSRVKTGAVFPNPLGTGTQQKQTYSFDNYGNITSIGTQIGAGATTTRSTPTAAGTNRLTGATSYDAAGSLTSWNGATYEYDAFNQLKHMVSGSEDWLYMYTADDERFWSYRNPTAGGESRFDLFTLRDLEGKTLRELANSNYTWTAWEDYVYRDGLLLAGYFSNGQRRHFHLDHLGSPRLVTNNAGGQSNYHVYYPFGEEASPFSTVTDRRKFTGQERDLANILGMNPTGDDLDYMHARHYSHLTGRFTSFDPVGGVPRLPQTWNRYAYVTNRPMVYTDPQGLFLSWLAWANAFTFYDSITVTDTGYSFFTGVDGLNSLIQGSSFWSSLSSLGDLGNLRGSDFSFSRTLDVSGMGLAAFADGVNLFGNPLEERGYYNPDELGLNHSRTIGEVTVYVELAIATAGVTAETAGGAQAGNYITNNVFRWGTSKRYGLHFHLGPGNAMKHHLPMQLNTWRHHAWAIVKRTFNNLR
jgi:RHS repeat-associated protein